MRAFLRIYMTAPAHSKVFMDRPEQVYGNLRIRALCRREMRAYGDEISTTFSLNQWGIALIYESDPRHCQTQVGTRRA